MPRPSLFDAIRKTTPHVSVGMVTANLLTLGSELKVLETAGVKLLHFDVMDGVFCPMTTIGPPVIAACKTPMFKDVHLMIDEPLTKLDAYVAAGADMITVHAESCVHIHRVFQALGKMTNANDPARGILRGVAINPGTPLETVAPLLDDIDMILLLAVNPGWGGQKFIPSTKPRFAGLQAMIKAAGKDILLAVDGGITRDNIAEVVRMGADIVVTGSAVFDGKNAPANAEFMVKAVKI